MKLGFWRGNLPNRSKHFLLPKIRDQRSDDGVDGFKTCGVKESKADMADSGELRFLFA
jgi:hypothetical protein